ncbi:MAG: hypothetical protein OXJ53_16965, partial [Gammaproteobacteria bacterium]|nr:hypothetical protein [Gammaproteobacteria bacterium]
MFKRTKAVAFGFAASFGLLASFSASLVQAAEAEAAQAAAGEIEEVVVVGSRRRDRSAADSPVPV